jgi:hypothetical protein
MHNASRRILLGEGYAAGSEFAAYPSPSSILD